LDGGNNWEQIDLGLFTPCEIYFTDILNGWTSSGPHHTADGGETWEAQFDEYWETGGVYFTDSLNGWVVGSTRYGSTGLCDGIILHTNDGGNTWDYQYDYYPSATLNSVYFTDSLKGCVAGGGYEIILKTTDGGNNWDTSYINNTGALCSIYFADSFNGWAVGWNGSIISTTDGGNTWESEPSGTSYDLKGVCFTENGYGWTVGEDGTILHADYSQIVGMHESKVQSPNFKVQTYPNPFTTSTTITYELQQPSTVQITIYNHLGEPVEVIRQKQSIGKQQVLWNAEGLPSGVYYCVLKTNEGTKTLKMIKLK
jgi:photosystem II stability/assembly factor-like uncharacterized protein